MTSRRSSLAVGALLVLLLTARGALPTAADDQTLDLTPRSWNQEERRRVEAAMLEIPAASPLAAGRRGAISGTYSAPAVYAGLEALRRGGSAADAALTTAIAQVTLAAGSWVSLSGTLGLLYYDAASGRVFSLNADYDTVRGEDDPLSIPGANDLAGDPWGGAPSGRATLVPGFVAGVEAAHGRFGRLPFAALWQPAIFYAEEGFEVSPYLAGFIDRRRDVLTRSPAAREIFQRPDGRLVGAGDRLRQPALAATMRRIASEGADHVYAGPWAERLVAAVRAEGGKLDLADLDEYRAWWTEPVHRRYRGYDVYGYGLPASGGLDAVEALALYEASGLVARGHYATSGDALFWLAQIGKVTALSFMPAAAREELAPGLDLSPAARLDEATTAAIWRRMTSGEWPLTRVPAAAATAAEPPRHSEAIVAVDRWGNMAALAHSINSLMWGRTGIFVDGVSINDSASFQQAAVAAAGPGERLPAPSNPLLVLADGVPVLASSAIGPGLHLKTLQALISVLDFAMEPEAANDAPYLMAPSHRAAGSSSERVPRGAFDPAVIARARALGLELEEVDASSLDAQGLWVGIMRQPEGGYLATSPDLANGAAFADQPSGSGSPRIPPAGTAPAGAASRLMPKVVHRAARAQPSENTGPP